MKVGAGAQADQEPSEQVVVVTGQWSAVTVEAEDVMPSHGVYSQAEADAVAKGGKAGQAKAYPQLV